MRLIPHRVPLSERPVCVQTRADFGHWEADLMLFSRPGELLLVAQERASRLLLATRLPGKAAAPIADQLHSHFRSLPPALRQSVTFDNGAEFFHHRRLALGLDMKTYFCDRHAPWQKGGIENAIGRLRRVLPRSTDLRKLSQNDIDRLAARYNNIPRKCLGFQTPAEIFTLQLLHFNCVSTPSLRSG
jgi:IS30 family transposase